MQGSAPMKAALAVGAVAVLALSSTGGGYRLKGYSPRRLIVYLLRGMRLPWTSWLAQGAKLHRVRTYAALVLLGFIGYRGQDYVARYIRQLLQYDRVNPTDELVRYPHQSPPQGDEVPSKPPKKGEGLSVDGAAAAAQPATTPDTVTGALLKHLSRGNMLDDDLMTALGEDGARVLTSVGHTFQLTKGAAISLAQKSRAVTLQPGETLFQARDSAADGVYVVVSGALVVRGDPRGAAMVVDDCLLQDGSGQEGGSPWHGAVPFTPGAGFGLDTNLYSTTSYGMGDFSGGGAKEAEGGPSAPVLCTFGPGSTLGENALLAGPGASRAVAVEARSGSGPTSLLHVDAGTYKWFVHQWPRSTLNFILTTTARQYRVAFFALVDFLGLPQAAFAAQEAHPHPCVRLEEPPSATAPATPSTPAQPSEEEEKNAPPPVPLPALLDAATAVRELPAGAALFSEGDAADCLFVLVSGAASAFVAEAGDVDDTSSVATGWTSAPATPGASANPLSPRSGGSRRPPVTFAEGVAAPPHTVWVGDLAPGSIAGGVSCFVDAPRRSTIVGHGPCTWAVFSRRAFLLAARDVEGTSTAGAGDLGVLLALAQRIAQSLTPLLRMFLGLGLQRVWLGAGDTLYEAGEEADGLYLCISGRLRIDLSPPGSAGAAGHQDGLHVTRGGVKPADDVGTAALEMAMGGRVRRLDVTRGESVGEVAVLARVGGGVRDHTVACVRDCELVRVTPEAFEWIAAAHPDIMRKFATTMAQRYGELLGRLHGVPPVATQPRLQPLQRTVQVEGGSTRHARASSTGRLHHAASLAGLNLMSSLTRGTAGVHPATRRPPSRTSLPHGATVRSEGRSDIATIAILPAGADGVGPHLLKAFVDALADSLRQHGTVAVVSADTVDDVLGVGCAAGMHSVFSRARITAWLSAQEERHRFTLLVGEAALPQWNSTVYSQADLALLVGTAGADPTPSALEGNLMHAGGAGSRQAPTAMDANRPSAAVARLAAGFGLSGGVATLLQSVGAASAPTPAPLSRHSTAVRHPHTPHVYSWARRELVLLYADEAAAPVRTREWLRPRSLSWHHHVRTSLQGDVARVARFIAGTAVGVVLGGGGARGLAHLGVFKALEERNIPVDFIGGTSQGAFMGGCYAKTQSARGAGELARELALQVGGSGLFLRMTLPVIAYFSGAFFNEVIQNTFGETQIEDLWIKYFCVSTNVTKDTMDVHHTGSLWRYARASMTIIGLLPPLMDTEGNLLVDGGYVNNLPVDVMHALCPSIGTIIAVDVENKDNSAVEGVDREQYGDSLSGWYLAGRALLGAVGLAKPLTIPSMSVFTMKVSYISHTMAMRSMIARLQDATARADPNTPRFLYIRPDVQAYSLLQYSKWTEIVNYGLMEAERVLDALSSPLTRSRPSRRRHRPRQLSASEVDLSSMAATPVASMGRGSRSLAILPRTLDSPATSEGGQGVSDAASGASAGTPVHTWTDLDAGAPTMDPPSPTPVGVDAEPVSPPAPAAQRVRSNAT